jgi:hypothetical protein
MSIIAQHIVVVRAWDHKGCGWTVGWAGRQRSGRRPGTTCPTIPYMSGCTRAMAGALAHSVLPGRGSASKSCECFWVNIHCQSRHQPGQSIADMRLARAEDKQRWLPHLRCAIGSVPRQSCPHFNKGRGVRASFWPTVCRGVEGRRGYWCRVLGRRGRRGALQSSSDRAAGQGRR